MVGTWLILLCLPESPFAVLQPPPPLVRGRLQIHDFAGFFSDEGVRSAMATVGEIRDRFPRYFTVDSFPKIPQRLQEQYQAIPADDTAAKRRFFAEWARAEATASRASGVYVLICREPGYIHLLSDREARTWFPQQAEDQAAAALAAGFRAARNAPTPQEATKLRDDALVTACEILRDAFQQRAQPQRRQIEQ